MGKTRLIEDVMTVVGKGLNQYINEPYLENEKLLTREGPKESLDKDVISSASSPFDPEGGIRLVKGNMGKAVVKVSAVALKNRIIDILPNGPAYFPKDQLTDKSERFFVNEIIREKILINFRKEIPYSVEVVTESFEEEPQIIKIRSIIMVERSSQKGIIIGHKGEAIKNIGTQARIDMEVFFDKKIFLDLQVKVNKNWRSSEKQLKRFGYNQK